MNAGARDTTSPSARSAACQELLEHASEYLDADLGEDLKEHIRRHLERCGTCRGFVSTLEDTIAMLHTLPNRTLPEDLKQRLLKACREQPASS